MYLESRGPDLGQPVLEQVVQIPIQKQAREDRRTAAALYLGA